MNDLRMVLLNLEVKHQKILGARHQDRIVVGGSTQFVYLNILFDEEWEGSAINVIFTNDHVAKPEEARWDGKPVEVPAAMLVTGQLRISCVGRSNGGNRKITTEYMADSVAVVRPGEQVGYQPTPQEVSLWEQTMAAIGSLLELKITDKSNLVAAINEVFGRSVAEVVSSTAPDGAQRVTIRLENGTEFPFEIHDGTDGVGIEVITSNEDGTWTIVYTDGATQTIEPPSQIPNGNEFQVVGYGADGRPISRAVDPTFWGGGLWVADGRGDETPKVLVNTAFATYNPATRRWDVDAEKMKTFPVPKQGASFPVLFVNGSGLGTFEIAFRNDTAGRRYPVSRSNGVRLPTFTPKPGTLGTVCWLGLGNDEAQMINPPEKPDITLTRSGIPADAHEVGSRLESPGIRVLTVGCTAAGDLFTQDTEFTSADIMTWVAEGGEAQLRIEDAYGDSAIGEYAVLPYAHMMWEDDGVAVYFGDMIREADGLNHWVTVRLGEDMTCVFSDVVPDVPAATADTLGGIKADPAIDSDTKGVYIGKDGKLHVAPDVLVVQATNEGSRWVADVGSETIRSFGGNVILRAEVDGVAYSYRYQRYGSVTDNSVDPAKTYTGAVFDQPNISPDAIERIEVVVDRAANVHIVRTAYQPPVQTTTATCHDEAAPAKLVPNVWYVSKDLPRPAATPGLMIDVTWEHGCVDSLGYDVRLVWGAPGAVDNELILDQTNTSDKLAGEHSVPVQGTVRYQLVESSGHKSWQYVSGPLLPRQFSSATPAATADKAVPGMQLSYIPGQEIYVQLDHGNTADTMRLVPDEGPTLPVYGNGQGTKTGTIPAGYILQLKNAGDHWQIINSTSSGGGTGPATAAELPAVVPSGITANPNTQAVLDALAARDALIINGSIDTGYHVVTDKTYEQIKAANEQNRPCTLVLRAAGQTRLYPLATITAEYALFVVWTTSGSLAVYGQDYVAVYADPAKNAKGFGSLRAENVRCDVPEGVTAERNIQAVLNALAARPTGPLEPLTFTGAVSAEYDGTKPVNVEIPAGGGGDKIDIAEYTTVEPVGSFNVTLPKHWHDYKIIKIKLTVPYDDAVKGKTATFSRWKPFTSAGVSLALGNAYSTIKPQQTTIEGTIEIEPGYGDTPPIACGRYIGSSNGRGSLGGVTPMIGFYENWNQVWAWCENGNVNLPVGTKIRVEGIA